MLSTALPRITSPSNRDIVARVGEDLTLVCVATGIPTPAVNWKRNGQTYSPQTVSLQRA